MILRISKEKDLLKIQKVLEKMNNHVIWRVNPLAKKELEIKHPMDKERVVKLDKSTINDIFGELPKVKQIIDDIAKSEEGSVTKRFIRKEAKRAAKEVKKALKKGKGEKYTAFNVKVFWLIDLAVYRNKKKALFVLFNENNTASKITDACLDVVFKHFEVEALTLNDKPMKKALKAKSKKRKKAIKRLIIESAVGENGEEKLEKLERSMFPLLMNAEILRRIGLKQDPTKVCNKKYMARFFNALNKKQTKKLNKLYKKFRKLTKNVQRMDVPKNIKKLRDAEAVVFVRYYLGALDKSVRSNADFFEFIKPVCASYGKEFVADIEKVFATKA